MPDPPVLSAASGASSTPTFGWTTSAFAGHHALTWALVIAALYFGREFILPIALAVLLAFVLDPPAAWLRRRGVPRGLAAGLVVLFAVGLIAALGYLANAQVRAIASDLPTYQANITQKLRAYRTTMREPSLIDRVGQVVGSVEKEIAEAPRAPQAASAERSRAAASQRVEVVPSATSPWQRMRQVGEAVAGPAATAGLVLVLLVLILLNLADLRDRLMRLMGGNLHRTTDAMGEAAERVSRYLLMQLAVNGLYAVPLAVGLWLIGVPGALTWGLLAAVLRFIPYLGPLIGSIFPLLLAFAIDPGWSMLLWTGGLILGLELVINNVIEPWLYGSSTGLSAFSLIVAASFWTLIWGPIGLALSTPITVLLLVMGRHVPQLRFLDVMLGSEPALDPPTRLYQRLLAGDEEEASELAIEAANQHSVAHFYDTMAVPAMRLASNAYAERSTAEHRNRVALGVAQLLDELRLHFPTTVEGPTDVVCIGGRWEMDGHAAEMLAHAIGLAGHNADVATYAREGGTLAGKAGPAMSEPKIAVLSFFSPEPSTHVRYLARKVRRRWPHVRLIAALWNVDHRASITEAATLGCDEIAYDVEQVLHQVLASLTRGSDDELLMRGLTLPSARVAA